MYQSPATGVRGKSIITRRISPGQGKITKKFHEGVATSVYRATGIYLMNLDYNRPSPGIQVWNSRQNIYYIFETRRRTRRRSQSCFGFRTVMDFYEANVVKSYRLFLLLAGVWPYEYSKANEMQRILYVTCVISFLLVQVRYFYFFLQSLCFVLNCCVDCNNIVAVVAWLNGLCIVETKYFYFYSLFLETSEFKLFK